MELIRVTTDGKQFKLGDQRFRFRGVSYGTFAPRVADGAQVPERVQIKHDFRAIADHGFTVVRTYTAPPHDLVETADDFGLHLLAGIFWPDWRYLLGASRRQQRRCLADARAEVRAGARRLARCPTIAAVCVGNEVPADVVRWVGADRVSRTIGDLAAVVHDEDPELLVTYGNYPTTEYLRLDDLDFLTFNVFLEQQPELRRYLTRLQHLAGDRPLVLGEIGLHSGASAEGERRQAEVIDWHLETALERGVAGTTIFSWTDEWWVGTGPVEGWQFGLTETGRTPRPALAVAAEWNRRTVRDLRPEWPPLSVVICAYNAAATLDECLSHTCALDYPALEILVVDDGSTDATADIARRYPEVRLVSIEHAGLSVARNAGLGAARHDLVAYLDSDAYPSPEWPYYLVLGLDGPMVAGVGGPNVAPADDGWGAQQVARSPGGPVHVLLSDSRAEHVPGCNMAFWKKALVEIGGFDPVYTSAGDDVDLCWKLLDADWELGFHPAALVWHHSRSGLRAYLRQQKGYGRAEALVEARHPDRFTSTGTARWRGRIYHAQAAPAGRQRIYRGMYGSAAYQSIYRDGGHSLDLAHQLGSPLAAVLLCTAPLAFLHELLLLPAALAVAAVLGMFVVDFARATPPRRLRRGRLRFRAGVALHHLLQPLVRAWGRRRHAVLARRDLPPRAPVPGPVRRERGVLVMPCDRPRADLIELIVAELRRAGLRVVPTNEWDDHDGQILGSWLVRAELRSSAFPQGCVQLRAWRRPRWPVLLGWATVAGVLWWAIPVAGVTAMIAAVAETARGVWRTGPFLERVIGRAAGQEQAVPT